MAGEDRSHEESDGTASDMEEGAVLSQEDSQNEDDADGSDETYVSQLMAASTTIGYIWSFVEWSIFLCHWEIYKNIKK